MTDTSGRPLHVAITEGQRHDVVMAEELLHYVKGGVNGHLNPS